MKVVLFCGGLGLRLRDYADHIPKPMVPIGYRPILWHVMKYFAHFGHKDFILCLGHRGDLIKQYFLNYDECLSNDFVFSKGGKSLELGNYDIHDWKITFADTGLRSNIGQRLAAVEKYVGNEKVFLANYTDGLTDLNLPAYLEHARHLDKIATFLSVKPNLSYHIAETGADGVVTRISESSNTSSPEKNLLSNPLVGSSSKSNWRLTSMTVFSPPWTPSRISSSSMTSTKAASHPGWFGAIRTTNQRNWRPLEMLQLAATRGGCRLAVGVFRGQRFHHTQFDGRECAMSTGESTPLRVRL
jgi:UTP-glucose-1-phosphate uridylyltransferase